MLREALAIYKELRLPSGTEASYIAWQVVWGLTQLLLAQRRGGEAIPLLEEVAASLRGAGDKMALAITLAHLSMARLAMEDSPGARSALSEALELSRHLDQQERMRTVLQREPYPATGLATWTIDRQTHEHTERALREALGDEGFRRKFSEGMQMSPEDAATVAAALR
jgi:hypothetical protein